MNNFQSQQHNQQLLQQYFHRFRQGQTNQNQNNGQLVASNSSSGVPNNVNGDYWSWWNNMWLQSMNANKAYYYYYTSKAALMNQSSIGLIRSARSAKMPQTNSSSSSSKPLHQNLYPTPTPNHDHNHHDLRQQAGTSSTSINGNQNNMLMNNNNFEGRLLGGGNGGWSHYNDLEMSGDQNEIKTGKNQERPIQPRVNNHHHVEDAAANNHNHHDDNDVYPFSQIPLDMPLMEGDLPNDSLPQSPLTSRANMSSYAADEYDAKLYTLECYECKVTYNTTNCRPVEEACGHMKCRICFISNEDGCPQCRMDKNRLKDNLNNNALPKKKIIATYGRTRPIKKKSPTINVSKGLRSNDIASSSSAGTSTSTGGGLTYSSATTSLNNNNRRDSSSLSDTGNNNENKRRSKRIHDTPSNSLEIDSNSLLGNNDNFPPPAKLLKDNFNSVSGIQVNSTDGNNTIRITNDIESLATPGSSNSTTLENSSNNVIEKIRSNKSKKKRSPVLIHAHITILSSGKEGLPAMYQCNVCTKKFKTKAHIKYHEFCQNGEKPFKCESCGQGFIAKSHYEYHLRTHTGERPYVCPKCGKGFNQRGKVTRHLRSHTGEKPFVCQSCGRGFANAQALRSHNLIHTGERPYPCQYCNKRFTGMTNLKKHVITHTGERPFMCVHCGKSFGLKWTLDLHLRTHSSERPHACDQCARAFSNSKDLRRHLVIHSGERPFKCWICGTTFRRKDNLDRHIKNTHNQPRDVARQLANEAAAEYLASQKDKAPNPTTIQTNQNLNNKKAVSIKTNTPQLPKGANMTNDKSKKIQESIDKFSRSVKKKSDYFQKKSSSIEEEAMRLLNDTTPPDITTSIENGQLSIHVKMEPPEIENFGEPESAVSRDGEMTENRKPEEYESVVNNDGDEITENMNHPDEQNPSCEELEALDGMNNLTENRRDKSVEKDSVVVASIIHVEENKFDENVKAEEQSPPSEDLETIDNMDNLPEYKSNELEEDNSAQTMIIQTEESIDEKMDNLSESAVDRDGEMTESRKSEEPESVLSNDGEITENSNHIDEQNPTCEYEELEALDDLTENGRDKSVEKDSDSVVASEIHVEENKFDENVKQEEQIPPREDLETIDEMNNLSENKSNELEEDNSAQTMAEMTENRKPEEPELVVNNAGEITENMNHPDEQNPSCEELEALDGVNDLTENRRDKSVEKDSVVVASIIHVEENKFDENVKAEEQSPPREDLETINEMNKLPEYKNNELEEDNSAQTMIIRTEESNDEEIMDDNLSENLNDELIDMEENISTSAYITSMIQAEENKVEEIVENNRPVEEENLPASENVKKSEMNDRMNNYSNNECNECVENYSALTLTPAVQVEEESMRILYAKATARSEPSNSGDGSKKVVLMYAEALGVKGNGSPNDPYQYVYTSTKPNQEFYQSSESHAVQISSPKFYPVGPNVCLDQVERWFKSERNSSGVGNVCCANSSSINSSNSIVNAATSTDPIDIQVKTDGTGYADASLIVHHHEYLDPPQEHPEDYSLGPVINRRNPPSLVDDYTKYLRYNNLRCIEVDEGVEMVVKTENEK